MFNARAIFESQKWVYGNIGELIRNLKTKLSSIDLLWPQKDLQQIFQSLINNFRKLAPPCAAVFNSFTEFKGSRVRFKDEQCNSRSPIAVTDETIATVAEMVGRWL